MTRRVLFLFGPNLGALERRDASLYGGASLAELMAAVGERGRERGAEVEWRQSDHEGELVGWLLGASGEGFEAVVLNPGALSHYSYAVHDAVETAGVPVLEVHLSNIHAREPFRRRSVVAPAAVGVIAGLGVAGYHLALDYLLGLGPTR